MKQGLKNPAIAAFASSPKGQEAIAKTTNLGITVLKIGLVLGALTVVYYKIFKGFSKVKEDANYKPSNISVTQAKARAEAIYTALLGTAKNYNTVEKNLTGLNHNGFVRLYNEFGERRSALLTNMNLVEWLQDQFNEDDIAKLRFLIKGFF
jgi:hypothetical protein